MQSTVNNSTDKKEIMIIDDSANDLRHLSDILTGGGYLVRQEMSGDAALESIELKKPDLVLLAARIPGVDGFEVCKSIKTEPDTAAIPVIFIASSEKSKDKAIGFKAGCDDFIDKPYQPEDILTRVSSRLEIVYLRQELEKSKQRLTEDSEKQKQIDALKDVDPLTGLFNRRVYDEELMRFDKDEKYFPLTFIMADVNGLGLVNNAFGYQQGDIVLQKVASILRKECRADDVLARIGDDKFVILLPCCDDTNANSFIDRINKAVAKETVGKIAISLSIGFSIKRDIYDDMDDVFQKAEDEMYRHKLSDNLSIRSKIIFIIMNALFEKNPMEKLHSKKVSDLSESIAVKMKFSDYEIKQVKLAGLVHDIGKVGIDENVLRTKGKLTGDGWNEVHRHPEIGYRILSSSKGYTEIANFVLDHHERWDGSGYPRGLKGAEISLKARIIAVADAYCVMTAEKSYKPKLSEEEAVNEIARCSGTQFDPEIARVFIQEVLGRKQQE